LPFLTAKTLISKKTEGDSMKKKKVSYMGFGKPILPNGRVLRNIKHRRNKLNPNIALKDAIGIITEDGNVKFF